MLSNKRWKLCILLTAVSFMFACHVIRAFFHGYSLSVLNPSFRRSSSKFSRSLVVNDISHITRLNDVVFTIRTGKYYHHNRLELILKTWFQHVKEQVSRKMTKYYVFFSYTSKLRPEINLRFCT